MVYPVLVLYYVKGYGELSKKLILPFQNGEPLNIQDPSKLKYYTIEQLFPKVSNDEDYVMGEVTDEGTDVVGGKVVEYHSYN